MTEEVLLKWENRKEDIIYMYNELGKTSKEIGDYYNVYGSTILTWMKRWGIPRRTKRYNSKYTLDIDYFKNIDTEEKAYWVGFILADGHISKHNVLNITVQKRDIDILEKFLKSIKSNAPIKVDSNNNPTISIRSKDIKEDLYNMGFNNRKSYSLDFSKVLSKIKEELIIHFIRGMFDGDGSINVYKYDYVSKPQYHLGYTGLKEVCDYFKNYFDINRKLVKEEEYTYTCVTRDYNKIIEIRNKLYNNANIYLDRKYEKFKSI